MSRCFMDVRIGPKSVGRMVIELDDERAPRTSHNFRMLCSGEEGFSKKSRKALHYRGHPFHRIIPGFMAQGGDITHGNGTGGESVYGKKFRDEYLDGKHNGRGILSMANSGPNTNGSQFFLTFSKASHLDGRHVVFGRVVEGIEVLDSLEAVNTNAEDRPRLDVVIEDCGVLEDKSTDRDEKVAASSETKQEVEETKEQPDFSTMTDRQKRLFELRMKMNEARKLTKKEVMLEQRRMSETPAQRKHREHMEYNDIKQTRTKTETEEKEDPKKWLLNETAESVLVKQKKKAKKKAAAYGLEAFSTDNLYRAYKKRTEKVSTKVMKKANDESRTSAADDLAYGGVVDEAPEDVDAMVKELEETQERRSKFRRRRQFYEDETVTFINERNRNFNKKINRFFDEYTAKIKADLEKGTA